VKDETAGLSAYELFIKLSFGKVVRWGNMSEFCCHSPWMYSFFVLLISCLY